jgi:peptide/nickel transport system substrate-binding protein
MPNGVEPTPDLATGMPKVSNGGKTLTIHIKPNIKYSAPLQNRTVKSADIKYGMERTFLPQVGNGYSGVYWSSIKGVKAFQDGKAKDISGLQTPNATTLVINMTTPVGVLATGQALALPGTIPVPKDYAAKYDKGEISHYGEHQVFTGPYMIKNDGHGNLTGYQAGKKIQLVRNPSWNAKTDFRPAYLNTITALAGNDLTVGSRRILSGQNMVSGDFAAPPTEVLKSALSNNKSQLVIEPSQGIRFIALNTTVKPLDNINVRKAIFAATDPTTLRLTRGGPTLGPLATHFIPPGIPGFDQAGGLKGPNLDFIQHQTANLALAHKYLKAAGFSNGMYHGPKLLMVGDNQPPASKTGEAFQSQLAKIGVQVQYRQVPHATMLTKFCGVPKSKTAICPNLGWGKDFFDAQSMIDPIFNGKNIVPVGNANYAQVNDPKLNAMMNKAETLTTSSQRAVAWAKIDDAVSQGAYIIPWLWDNQINFDSKNVAGVRNKFNSSWDLSFTSIK